MELPEMIDYILASKKELETRLNQSEQEKDILKKKVKKLKQKADTNKTETHMTNDDKKLLIQNLQRVL